MSYKLLIHSAVQIVQVVSHKELMVTGEDMNNLVIIKAADGSKGCSIVVDNGGCIAGVGTDKEISDRFPGAIFKREIDACDHCIIPGLIDAHTHALWAGDRVHEFAMKLAGATYMEVHKAGGGIHYTVDHVHQSSEDTLYRNLRPHIDRMLRAGTTLTEMKSGYGLDLNNELKMLKVIEKAKREQPLEISSTYCGAHAIPKGSNADEAMENILDKQLPALKTRMESGELKVDNIDVFCEQGVFNVEQTRKILLAGKELGLAINFHGEELHRLNSAEMGCEIGARAISHLEEISDEGINAMASAQCIAVLLPTTAYILRLQPPPVRKLIAAGVPVALGSDLNPNAHCLAMPIVMHLACVTLHMSMEEALVACTLNAAASIGRSRTHGSLEEGKMADMLLIHATRWEHLIYQLGSYHELISHVIKKGDIVHSKS